MLSNPRGGNGYLPVDLFWKPGLVPTMSLSPRVRVSWPLVHHSFSRSVTIVMNQANVVSTSMLIWINDGITPLAGCSEGFKCASNNPAMRNGEIRRPTEAEPFIIGNRMRYLFSLSHRMMQTR